MPGAPMPVMAQAAPVVAEEKVAPQKIEPKCDPKLIQATRELEQRAVGYWSKREVRRITID